MNSAQPHFSHERSTTPAESRLHTPLFIRRFVSLIVVVVLGITLVGYIRGITEPAPLTSPLRHSDRTTRPDVPQAVRYSEMPSARQQAHAGMTSHLDDLKFPKPGPFDPVIRTEEMKLAALVDRSRVRAYDSAPPVIPHGITQSSAVSCLACHGQGIIVGDRIATKVSHPHYTNCTQCHVEGERTQTPWATTILAENDFQGIGRAGPGTRAWPGAPPTIPHTTWMRQDCTSCHGLIARPGIRTTHPWLTNCTQCHAPSAQLDQVEFLKDQP